MRYASIRVDDEYLLAVLEGGEYLVIDGFHELDAAAIAALHRSGLSPSSRRVPVVAARLRPVVPRPGKVLCVGLNYADHIEECEQLTPDYPVLFAKFASSLVGARDDVPLPPESAQVDYEGELAVVIGASLRRVDPATALRGVAGYTVSNDGTMRDYQFKTHQWLAGKAWDKSTPLGPVLVTPDEISDPQSLRITTRVNGETRQDSTTELMLFHIGELISRISEFTTLEPGDVILTGTPSGVGDKRVPPVYLNDGDVVEVEIQGIGAVANRFVRETRAVA